MKHSVPSCVQTEPKQKDMPESAKDHMQVAKDEFLQLSPDDRLIFMAWAQKEVDKDLYGIAREERNAFVQEVKDGLKRSAERAEQLGKDAVEYVEQQKGSLDEKLRNFLKGGK